MTSSYKYSEQIALHNMAVAILEMKIEFMRRLDANRETLEKFDNGKWNDPICLMNDRRTLVHNIEIYEKCVARATKRYYKFATQVCTAMAEVEQYDKKIQNIPVFGQEEASMLREPEPCIGYSCEYGKAELNSHHI